LKNFENRGKYEQIKNQAKEKQITAVQYIHSITRFEAEAALFRCEVFESFDQPKELYPANPKYLKLYEDNNGICREELIKKFQRFIIDEGLVQRQFSAKAYYYDSYQFFARNKAMPAKYEAVQEAEFIELPNYNI